jgi:CRP-like cAMP-binding protein
MATSDGEAAKLLAATALFAPLSDDDRAAIAGSMSKLQFEPGALIFQRGDPGRDVLLVVSGSVRLSVMTPEGRELSLLHAGPGEILGEIAVLDGGQRTADARAVGRVTVLKLQRAVLVDELRRNSAMATAAITFLCRRLRATNDILEAIALYPIEARIARFLLSVARLKGAAAGKDGRVPVELGMSQGDLALLIGASRPKVSMALQALEASGAIARAGERTHCDIEALEKLAESG